MVLAQTSNALLPAAIQGSILARTHHRFCDGAIHRNGRRPIAEPMRGRLARA